MNVLVANKYWFRKGGADAHAIDLEHLLRTSGHQTTVCTMRHPSNEPPCSGHYFVPEVDFRAAGTAGRVRGALQMLYSLEARDCVRRVLRENRPDIAHVHNIYHQISPSILPELRRAGVPVVMTVHDLKPVCPSYRMLARGQPCERCKGGRFYQAAVTGCYEGSRLKSAWLALEMYFHEVMGFYRDNVQLYLCPSRFYRDKLAEFGLPPERLRVLPYFLNPDGYRPASGTGSGILYFGRLSPEKGLPTLIQAVAHLSGAQLVIAGEGPERRQLEAAARPLGDRVRFVGYLSGEALHEAVRQARVIAVPSEWYENCPISVLESFALGRPVVVSATGGLPELVYSSQCGWQFAPGDKLALADCLDQALSESHAVARRRSIHCREVFERRYGPGMFLERLLGFYAEIARS